MKKNLKKWLFIFPVIAVIIVLLLMVDGDEDKPAGDTCKSIEGKILSSLDLIDVENSSSIRIVPDRIKPMVIIIFPRPCAPCSPNMALWKQMYKLSCNQAEFVGIVLEDAQDAFKLLEKKTKFKVFMSQDPESMMKEFSVKDSRARTILYNKGKIQAVHCGDLNVHQFNSVLETIKTQAAEKN